MKLFVIHLITLYQKTLSPDHGVFSIFFPFGVCRFYPTCSEYTKRSIVSCGIIKGIGMGSAQLLHCHPFSKPKIKNPNFQADPKSKFQM